MGCRASIFPKAPISASTRLIDVRPGEGGNGLAIQLVGEIAAMVRLGLGEAGAKQTAAVGDRGLFERSVKVVAGTRNHLGLLLTG